MPSMSALKWLGQMGSERLISLWTKIFTTAGSPRRRHVLGNEYVDRALANINDFNRQFQQLTTEYCWGEVWGDETLSPREHSILTLGMVAALGKMGEFANHVRGAQVNGLMPD